MSQTSRALSLIDDALRYVQTYKFSNQVKEEYKDFESETWSGKSVRKAFIDFFVEKHNHTFVPSSPVVPPENETSLLFTNAGMNQFKPIFLGTVGDEDDLAKLKRACNSQKCIRAGGKHNDLDDVGKDTYHHTFFEMLGNWSFGDYFKEGAIAMAWELLVDIYKLNPEYLYATYFGGNKEYGLSPDNEAKKIWKKYLPESRILPFGMKDNFWEMGETGPCGPCTEIHYDRMERLNSSAAYLVNADDPSVIEIWNNVFIQFNRDEHSKLHLLPNKHVDTGMGFERITSILQNKLSNYDTDIFMPIINEIQLITKCKIPYKGKIGDEDKLNGNIDMAYRVVADHIRTLTFSIADGAQPGSNGRDYVIRRVLRRGIRYGQHILGGKLGFFSKLVDIVINEMNDAFPELKQEWIVERVKTVIKKEEELFDKALKDGEKRFKQNLNKFKKNNIVSGKFAFQLHSTYGFPIDLTQLMAEEYGLSINMNEFYKSLEIEKEKSKGNKNIEQLYPILDANEIDYLKKQNIIGTNSIAKYKQNDIESIVVAIYKPSQLTDNENENENEKKTIETGQSGEFISIANENDYVGIILNYTSFYHESGGQVGDTGYIEGENMSFEVNYVISCGIYDIHYGYVKNGKILLNNKYISKVNYINRNKIAPNHTMTHILNLALRKTLGLHCDQKGSIVDSEKTRFDFSHNNKMSLNEILNTQKICQNIIKQNLNVYTSTLSKNDAFKIKSLRAMFGEKYPNDVRVVSIGISPIDALKDPENKNLFNYSIELCGGTHLNNTSEANDFLIINEEALSAGVRRIVAYTGDGAKEARNKEKELRHRINQALNMDDGPKLTQECTKLNGELRNSKISAVAKDELNKLLDNLNEKDKNYKKILGKQRKKRATEFAKQLIERVSKENIKYVVTRLDVGLDTKALKECIKVFHKKCNNVPIMILSGAPNEDKSKILVKCAVPKKYNGPKLSSKEWISQIESLIEGGGGGNDSAAEAKGISMDNINVAMIEATQFYEKLLLE